MTNIETGVHAGMAVAGFIGANKLIPDNLPVVGKHADFLVGLGIIGIGVYAVKSSAIVAFGVGATIEGAMVSMGLKL